MVKHLSTMQETWVRSLGREDPLEKAMAPHSSTIAWKIPWTEEPGSLHSPWGRKESDMTERLHLYIPKTQICLSDVGTVKTGNHSQRTSFREIQIRTLSILWNKRKSVLLIW